jgi:hypothetical protein
MCLSVMHVNIFLFFPIFDEHEFVAPRLILITFRDGFDAILWVPGGIVSLNSS